METATSGGQAERLPAMLPLSSAAVLPLPSAAADATGEAQAARARVPFASSEDEQMAEFIETVLALHAERKAAAAASGDLLGDTGSLVGLRGPISGTG